MTFDHNYCVITHKVKIGSLPNSNAFLSLVSISGRGQPNKSVQRGKTFTTPVSKTSKCTSPLGLTVAVLAERTLHNGIQCHEAHIFKQFKSLIGVCVSLPFVLVGKK